MLVFLQVLLGVVFVAAGVAKLGERYALLRLLRDTLRLPHRLAKAASRILPWLELALGIALAFGISVRVAAIAASALLVVFTLGLAFARLQGHRQLDCGCFGRSSESDRTSLLIARNALFLVPAVVLLADNGAVSLPEHVVLLLFAVGLLTLLELVRGARDVSRIRREILEYRQRMLAGK